MSQNPAPRSPPTSPSPPLGSLPWLTALGSLWGGLWAPSSGKVGSIRQVWAPLTGSVLGARVWPGRWSFHSNHSFIHSFDKCARRSVGEPYRLSPALPEPGGETESTVTQIKKNYKLDPGRAGSGGEGVGIRELLGAWAIPGGRRSPLGARPHRRGFCKEMAG